MLNITTKLKVNIASFFICGFLLFIALIPIIGWIWYLILMLTESSYEENEYGACPITVPKTIVKQSMQYGETIQDDCINHIQNAINGERLMGIIPIKSQGLKCKSLDII